MIGLSVINGLNGGKGRISPIVTALVIMVSIMGAYPLLNFIPVSALAGVMIVVVLHTFSWPSIPYLVSAVLPDRARAAVKVGSYTLPQRVDRYDAVIIATVTVVTVFTNLVYAVLSGVVLASLRFSWESSQDFIVEDTLREDGTKVYTVKGELFFGTAMRFHHNFAYKDDPERVELVLEYEPQDYSAQKAVEKVQGLYAKRSKHIAVKVHGAVHVGGDEAQNYS